MDTHGWSSSLGRPCRPSVEAAPTRRPGPPPSGAPPACPSASRPWSAGRAPSRARGTPPRRPSAARLRRGRRGRARVEVGLPPTAAVRDEAQRAVALPGRLAHRLPGPPGDGQGAPAGASASRPRSAGRGRPSGTTTSVDASHGMSGWSQTTTAKRSPPGAPRGVPKKSCPSSSVVSHGSVRARRERDHAAHRRRSDPLAVDLADGEHPVAVRRGAQPAVVVHLAPRAVPVRGHRCRTRAAARGPSQNHTRWSAWST